MQHIIVATAVELPLNQIVAGSNDRTQFPEQHIERLAASIAAEGLHQPITVRPLADGRYQIVAGECRYRACCLLERGTVPAIVKPMNDERASLAMLSENLQRRNLDPIDEAVAYQKRAAEFGWNAEQIAQKCSVSIDLVKRRLALLELLDDVQQQVRAGALPLGHAECLSGLDRNNQLAALRALTQSDHMPTCKQFRRLCSELLEQQSSMSMFDLESLWREKLAETEAVKAQKRAARDELATMRAELERERREFAAYKAWRELQQQQRSAQKRGDSATYEQLRPAINTAYNQYKAIAA